MHHLRRKHCTTNSGMDAPSQTVTMHHGQRSACTIRCGVFSLESTLRKKQKEMQNQMASLRACDDEFIRKTIFADIKTINSEIEVVEKQLTVEKAKRIIISEDQIIDRLTKLIDGDIKDLTYRRALIRIFVNRIYLYDDSILSLLIQATNQ